jgi:hypothetical protein
MNNDYNIPILGLNSEEVSHLQMYVAFVVGGVSR